MRALFKSSFGFLPCPVNDFPNVLTEYRVGFFIGSFFRCKKLASDFFEAYNFKIMMLSQNPSLEVKIIRVSVIYSFV